MTCHRYHQQPIDTRVHTTLDRVLKNTQVTQQADVHLYRIINVHSFTPIHPDVHSFTPCFSSTPFPSSSGQSHLLAYGSCGLVKAPESRDQTQVAPDKPVSGRPKAQCSALGEGGQEAILTAGSTPREACPPGWTSPDPGASQSTKCQISSPD